MKRLAILFILLTAIGAYGEAAAAQSNPYDETKACVGPAAVVVDYYFGVYDRLENGQDIQPVDDSPVE